jgi:hypothetical protein
MDEPVRGRLRPACPRGLTSPDPVAAPTPQPAAGRHPAKIPGKRMRTSRRNVSGRRPAPATAQDQILPAHPRKTISEIYAVDSGLVPVRAENLVRVMRSGVSYWLCK